jgi:hypothetical protein
MFQRRCRTNGMGSNGFVQERFCGRLAFIEEFVFNAPTLSWVTIDVSTVNPMPVVHFSFNLGLCSLHACRRHQLRSSYPFHQRNPQSLTVGPPLSKESLSITIMMESQYNDAQSQKYESEHPSR